LKAIYDVKLDSVNSIKFAASTNFYNTESDDFSWKWRNIKKQTAAEHSLQILISPHCLQVFYSNTNLLNHEELLR
jgi:hypothetical protein